MYSAWIPSGAPLIELEVLIHSVNSSEILNFSEKIS
jgi:hypothetical protein